MKFKSRHRSKNLRNLLICVGLLPVFFFISGCCPCEVEDTGKVLLIVKQVDNANPNLYNPEGEKNTADSTIDPQSAGFAALEQVGQGEENVPIVFTISGGSTPSRPM